MTGLRMMRPSSTSLRIVWRELALEISLTSLGSSQILRFPQPTTDAARRFCVRRLTLKALSVSMCISDAVVGGIEEVGQRGVVATPEALSGKTETRKRCRWPDSC